MQSNSQKIEENLITNLVRIFTAYGWYTGKVPETFNKKLAVVEYHLHHGMVKKFLEQIDSILATRRKDHNWGLYTPTFIEGVRSLLKAFASNNTNYGYKLTDVPLVPGVENHTSCAETPNENIFENLDHAKAAIDRLEKYGKTNIRYSLIEEYGEDRVRRDLRKVSPYAKLSIRYDEHQPDQLRDWLYDDGKVKMTVMYPIMPFVYLTLNN